MSFGTKIGVKIQSKRFHLSTVGAILGIGMSWEFILSKVVSLQFSFKFLGHFSFQKNRVEFPPRARSDWNFVPSHLAEIHLLGISADIRTCAKVTAPPDLFARHSVEDWSESRNLSKINGNLLLEKKLTGAKKEASVDRDCLLFHGTSFDRLPFQGASSRQ